MHRSRMLVGLLIVVSLVVSPCLHADVIAGIAGEISQSSYSQYLDDVLYTHLGDNRGFGAEHDLARDSILTQFASFGLDASLHDFTYSGSTYSNVIGVMQGRTRPDDIYIVSAHYDSVNNPGADDNASGVAGVLEIARVLSGHSFEATIVFAAFDREEQGTVGSEAWVQDHLSLNILGDLNLDMIGYNPSGSNHDWARIYSTTASDPLRTEWAGALNTYGGLSVALPPDLPASDHVPFETAGFMAGTLIEYYFGSNPNYHQLTDSVDTVGYIDYEYATNMVRGTAAMLADQAVDVPEPATLVLLGLGIPALAIIRRRRRAA